MDTVGNYECGSVCVICRTSESEIDYVFILDLDTGDGLTKKLPILKITGSPMFCYCVLGSILFMFDESGRGRTMCELDLGPYSSKSVEELIVDSSVVEEHRGVDMNAPKWIPCALPTPDGLRILVCSRSIRCNDDKEDDFDKRCDFEVYDRTTKRWFALPQLVFMVEPEAPRSLFVRVRDDPSGEWIEHSGYKDLDDISSTFQIEIGVAFINKSNTFIIDFPMGVVLAFNLDAPEQGWWEYKEEIRAKAVEVGFFFVDGVAIDPYTVSKGGVEHTFVLPPHFEFPCRFPYQGITMLEYIEKQKCVTCIVRSWIDEFYTGYPHLSFDIFHVDTNMVAKPTCIASFKFVLPVDNYHFYICSFFPIAIMHKTKVVAASDTGNVIVEAKAIPIENGTLSKTQDKDVVSEGLGIVYDQWVSPPVSGTCPKARYEGYQCKFFKWVDELNSAEIRKLIVADSGEERQNSWMGECVRGAHNVDELQGKIKFLKISKKKLKKELLYTRIVICFLVLIIIYSKLG